MHQKHNQTMERRMTGNCHVRCEAGENPETISKDYLSLFGRIPNFAETLAVVRKYNIRLCIVLQGLSQLKAIYEKTFDGIVGNCSIFTFLGTNDQESKEYVSKKLGKTTVRMYRKSSVKRLCGQIHEVITGVIRAAARIMRALRLVIC